MALCSYPVSWVSVPAGTEGAEMSPSSCSKPWVTRSSSRHPRHFPALISDFPNYLPMVCAHSSSPRAVAVLHRRALGTGDRWLQSVLLSRCRLMERAEGITTSESQLQWIVQDCSVGRSRAGGAHFIFVSSQMFCIHHLP